MSSFESSPDFEVLSTTSQNHDEDIEASQKTKPDTDDKKPDLVTTASPVSQVSQMITLPADIYEALLHRVSVLEDQLVKLRVHVNNRTLVETVEVRVPIVVSAAALSKGISDDKPEPGTSKVNKDAHPVEDDEEWGYTSKKNGATQDNEPRRDIRSEYSSGYERRELRKPRGYEDRYRDRESDSRDYSDQRSTNRDRDWDRRDRDQSGESKRFYEDNQRSGRSDCRRRDYDNDDDKSWNDSRRNDDYDSDRYYSDRRDNYRDSPEPERRSYQDDNYNSNSYRQPRRRESQEPSTSTGDFVPHYLCVFCDGTHAPDVCRKVTDYRDRRDILLSEGRCEICLSRHSTDRCNRKKIPCKYCDDDERVDLHHWSICPFEHR